MELKKNLSAEVLQLQNQNALPNQPAKMNKKVSVLESVYLAFGYKPPQKEELYQIICKYTFAKVILFVI